ncbi:MAG: cupin domain-containing protein [Acidobacteriota bacterium]|jgi:predicted cupin superfamily sugar epimerase|nr:cupin domain-containing protein [Acidobacteriota bacterium]
MSDRIHRIVQLLEMQPHPEGGFYKEVYRAELVLSGLPHGAPRNAATAIYYLLPAGAFSAFHRVCSDEVWHHYDGDPVALYILDEGGAYQKILLGHNLMAGERPQAVVPAHAWQAAEPLGNAFSLCGCTVAPGFDFADFEIAERTDLLERYPEYAAIIRRLTRE